MEKSGNLIIPSEKIMGKIQCATQPLFKDKNHVFVVIMGHFCITSMLEKPGTFLNHGNIREFDSGNLVGTLITILV